MMERLLAYQAAPADGPRHRDRDSPEAYNISAMEPRIQYAQTKDVVSIAYYAMGEGAPLVLMLQGGFTHTAWSGW